MACQPILVNGGFETNDRWNLTTTKLSATYSTERVVTGNRSLRLGIPPDEANIESNSAANQVLELPSPVSRITLRMQLWRGHMNDDKDFQYMQVLPFNNASNPIEEVWRSNMQQWEPYELDLTKLAGQTVRIHFEVKNNGTGGTTVMYVDDVTVEVCP